MYTTDADLSHWKEPVCLRGKPNRLVDLWEIMLKILAANLVGLWPDLLDLSAGWSLGGKDEPSPEEIKISVGRLMRIADALEWHDLAEQARRFIIAATDQDQPEVAKQALADDLRAALEHKTRTTQLLVISEGDNPLFHNAVLHLCGGPLKPELAISEEELNLSGKAIAVGLSTAAVAHAMRSVEAGLHSLGKSLGIQFAAPVELQEWANITQKITREIGVAEQQSKSQHKTEKLRTLGGLLIPADGFRIAWRNHVAHAREKYEEDEARKVLRNVADYLWRLSNALAVVP